MPLTERVSFKARLQNRNRLLISKHVRWQYKLESDQPLKVNIIILGVWGTSQTFLARMNKDGRIIIPKLTVDLLHERKADLTGYAVDVTLEPL